jgi:hypothetical protein
VGLPWNFIKGQKMKRLLLMTAVFVMVTAVPAMAVKRTGNDLLVDCGNLISTESIESVSKEKLLGIGYCIGLIDGLVTFNYVYEAVLEGEVNSKMVQMCLPQRISTRQSAEVIVKYLEDNSGRLTQSGQALAAQALVTAYPCGQETAK